MKRCLMMRGTRYAKHTAAGTQIVNRLSEDRTAKYTTKPTAPKPPFVVFSFLLVFFLKKKKGGGGTEGSISLCMDKESYNRIRCNKPTTSWVWGSPVQLLTSSRKELSFVWVFLVVNRTDLSVMWKRWLKAITKVNKSWFIFILWVPRTWKG